VALGPRYRAGMHDSTEPAAAEQLAVLVAGLRDWLASLDPAWLYTAPAEGEWSVMALFAHLTDVLTYWPDVATGIAAEPGRPFGRTLDDPDRTGAVLTHGADPVDQMLAAFAAAGAQAQARLAEIPEAGWAATGMHPKWGEITVADMVRRTLTRHLAGHWEQAKAAYQAVSAGA
jgi:DinB superfamily